MSVETNMCTKNVTHTNIIALKRNTKLALLLFHSLSQTLWTNSIEVVTNFSLQPFPKMDDNDESWVLLSSLLEFLKTAKFHCKITGIYCTASNYKNHHHYTPQKMSFSFPFVCRLQTSMECINCYYLIDTHRILRVELRDMNVSCEHWADLRCQHLRFSHMPQTYTQRDTRYSFFVIQGRVLKMFHASFMSCCEFWYMHRHCSHHHRHRCCRAHRSLWFLKVTIWVFYLTLWSILVNKILHMVECGEKGGKDAERSILQASCLLMRNLVLCGCVLKMW